MSRPTLVIPVVFPDPPIYPLDDANIVGLDGFRITLFGYWETPEKARQEEVRDLYESDARAVLYEMATQFSRAGAPTDVVVHFSPANPDEGELQARIKGTDADAILVPRQLTMWSNVLVPLRDDRRVEELLDFVSALDEDSIFMLELYHVTPDERAVETGSEMLERVKRRLLERGFTDNDIELTVDIADDAGQAIVEQASQHNLIVLGETEELDDKARFFGPVFDYIAEHTETPVAVIRA